MSDVENQVKSIISEQLSVSFEDIKRNSYFTSDLGADSIDSVELVMAIEEKFNFEIPDEEAEKILTVGQAIKYIKNKI